MHKNANCLFEHLKGRKKWRREPVVPTFPLVIVQRIIKTRPHSSGVPNHSSLVSSSFSSTLATQHNFNLLNDTSTTPNHAKQAKLFNHVKIENEVDWNCVLLIFVNAEIIVNGMRSGVDQPIQSSSLKISQDYKNFYNLIWQSWRTRFTFTQPCRQWAVKMKIFFFSFRLIISLVLAPLSPCFYSCFSCVFIYITYYIISSSKV